MTGGDEEVFGPGVDGGLQDVHLAPEPLGRGVGERGLADAGAKCIVRSSSGVRVQATG